MKGSISIPLILFLFLFLSCSGDNSISPPVPQPNLRLQSVSPTSLNRGTRETELEITGSGFQPEFSLDLGGGIQIVSKQYVDASRIKAVVNVNKNAEPGPRTVTVTVGAETSRLDSSLEVSSNLAPVARFTISPSAGTINSVFELNAETSTDEDGRIASYKWSFSDGAAMNGKKVQKQFKEKGEVAVKLTVTDDKKAASSLEKTLEIGDNLPPVAVFEMDPESGTNLTLFYFDASGSTDPDGTIRSYQWTFGDGKTSGGVRTTHKFNKDGDYTVELQVKDSSGATATASRKLKVKFFDVQQAEREIDQVCTQFLRLFDDLENKTAEEIVVGFSRNCRGREREIQIIEQRQQEIREASVDILGSTVVTQVNERNGRSYLRARFSGTFNDGTTYNDVATHFFTMVNENGEWKICDFSVEKESSSGRPFFKD